MKIAIAHSHSKKAQQAVLDIVEQCQTQINLNDLKYQAALFFSNYGLKSQHQNILTLLKTQLPQVNIIGCSSYAEMASSSDNGYCCPASVLILIASDEIQLHTGVIQNINNDIEQQALFRLIQEALPQEIASPSLCFIFPDFHINGNTLIKAFSEVLGNDIPIFGGVAADNNFTLKSIKQFYNSQVYEHSVPFLIIDGPLHSAFGLAIEGLKGDDVYEPIETRDKTLLKIGKASPIAYLKKYLSTLPKPPIPLVGCMLSVKPTEGKTYYEDILEVDEDNHLVFTNHPLPKTAKVQLVAPIISEMKQDIEEQVTLALDEYGATGHALEAVCLFSCSSRAETFGYNSQRKLEYETVLKTIEKFYCENEIERALPKIAGFYAHGEIASEAGSRYHSSSLVIVLLGQNIYATQNVLPQLCDNLKKELASTQEKLTASEQARLKAEAEVAALQQQITDIKNKKGQKTVDMTKKTTQARLLTFATLIKVLKAVHRKNTMPADCFTNTDSINESALARMIMNQYQKLTEKPFPVTEDALRKFIMEAMKAFKDSQGG